MGHYTGVDWKAPVATELLVLLDREKVAATAYLVEGPLYCFGLLC